MSNKIEVAKLIKQDICDGGYSNNKLPSIKDLANAYEASVNTIMAALQILVREGYLDHNNGSGYYILTRNSSNNKLNESDSILLEWIQWYNENDPDTTAKKLYLKTLVFLIKKHPDMFNEWGDIKK